MQFSYDAENQPISVSGSSSGNYVYDGNLKRVKQTVNGATIYNVYDKAGQLVHVDKRDAGKSTDYIHGAQGTLARITNNAVTYLHHDSLGSAQSGTDSSGAILWQEAYTPYGEALNDVTANQDLAGFTGHVKDDATGLSYMQARYYDPVIGRFYSNDPVDFLGHLKRGNPTHGFNRYTYANNNPYKFVDPDGRAAIACAVPPVAAGCAAVAQKVVEAVVIGAILVHNALRDSPTDKAIEDVKEGKGKAKGEAGEKGQLEGAGGNEGALSDLGKLPLVPGTEWTSPDGTRSGGTLEDGRKANVHPSGGGDSYPQGTPTLEIQKPNGKTEVKIRNPEETSS